MIDGELKNIFDIDKKIYKNNILKIFLLFFDL